MFTMSGTTRMGHKQSAGETYRLTFKYPLVICYIAIEHGPVELVDFSINSMVIFDSFLYVYQGISEIKPSHSLEHFQ